MIKPVELSYYLTLMISCILPIVFTGVESKSNTKKELHISVNSKQNQNGNSSIAQDLEPEGTMFIMKGASMSNTQINPNINSGYSSGVRRLKRTEFGTVAKSSPIFNYPTRYNIGRLDDNVESSELDDENTHETVELRDDENSYTGNGNKIHIESGSANYGSPNNRFSLRTKSDISHLGYSGRPLPFISSYGTRDVKFIGKDIDSDKEYRKGAKSQSEAKHETASGEKTVNGYKVNEDFDKAEEVEREKVHHEGRYDAATGSKKGDLDEAKRYSESRATVAGQDGEAFEKSKGHKKGHKTTGFHNVYHKDEYKKDTTFYDDEHVSAHEEAFGSQDSEHEHAEGSHEKVEKLNNEFHEDERTKRGSFTNGHQYGGAQGHDREYGEEERYEKGAEFTEEENHEFEKEEASSSGSSHKAL